MILLRQKMYSISNFFKKKEVTVPVEAKRGYVGKQVESLVLKEVPGLSKMLATKSNFIKNSYPHNIEVDLIVDKLNQILKDYPKERIIKEVRDQYSGDYLQIRMVRDLMTKALNNMKISEIEFFPFKVILYISGGGELDFKVKDDETKLIYAEASFC